MKKCGLVLEGGGLRGIFSTGILDVMMQNDIEFPYIIGSSFGAINGGSFISKQIGRTRKVVLSYINDPRYMSYMNMLKEKSYCGIDFMYNVIPNRLVKFDYDTFYQSKTKFKITVTNCLTGEAEYIEKSYIPKDILMDVFRATGSLPLISPMVKIGNTPYLDGGLVDSIPIKKAIADGYEKNVIVLTRDKNYRKVQSENLFLIKIFYKKYPKLIECIENRYNMYNETIEYIEQLEKEGKAFVIRPKKELKLGRLEKNKDKISDLYNYGYKTMEELFEKIREW